MRLLPPDLPEALASHPLWVALWESVMRLQDGDGTEPVVDVKLDIARIVRYRRMGYSAQRIAELFGVPLYDVVVHLRQQGLL